MKRRNIYACYENGTEVFRGVLPELKEQFLITSTSMWKYLKGGLKLNRRYEVRVVGQEEFKPALKPMKDKRTEAQKKFDEVIDYAVRHLNEYGNTVLPDDDLTDEYLKTLKKMGYKCELKQYYNYKGQNIVIDGSVYNKRKFGADNIIRWIDYDSRRV